jgi:hypothetical protein
MSESSRLVEDTTDRASPSRSQNGKEREEDWSNEEEEGEEEEEEEKEEDQDGGEGDIDTKALIKQMAEELRKGRERELALTEEIRRLTLAVDPLVVQPGTAHNRGQAQVPNPLPAPPPLQAPEDRTLLNIR